MKQHIFQFNAGAKYVIKNQQPIDSTYLEFTIRPMESVANEELWFVEILLQHAFDAQKAAVVYSPLVISPASSQEAKFVTSVSLAEIDSYLFAHNTLYIDVQVSDEPFSSAGGPAMPGSSVQSLTHPIPFVGLHNLGSTGYMNSVLQALFQLPRFREAVYRVGPTTRTVRELQRLFGGLHVASKVCSTRLLAQTLQWNEVEPASSRINPAQRDAQAFFRLLLTHLRNNATDPAVCDLFISRYATSVRSLPLETTKAQYEIFDIPLEVRGSSLLIEAFGKFVEPQLLSGPEQYFADPSRLESTSGAEFLDLAPVLVFTLRRLDFNMLTGKREQIADFFSFPDELDLTKYIQHSREQYVYDLFAVLVHSGHGSAGHHFAFLKIAEQWYHFNDSVVSIASREQATVQNFGGSSNTAAYMLIYTRRSLRQLIFQPCELPNKIRDYVSEVQLRAPQSVPRSHRSLRTFTLITEDDVRKRVLHGEPVSDIGDLPGVIELDDGSSNHDLYNQVAVHCGREPHMIRIWKVDDHRMPTTIITDNTLKCPQKDMVLFVQDLLDPQLPIPKTTKIAFLSFFFPTATPKIQFIGTAPVMPTQTVAQVFPFVWSILGIPGVLFNVYCDKVHPCQPISQGMALIDLGINNSASFVLEAGIHIQTRYQVEYCKPKPDDSVSYYSKIRANDDLTAAEYLEQRTPQYRIQIYRVADQRSPVVTITAPEHLPVTELPDFILFATKDNCDAKRDTFQLFRRQFEENTNEVLPYVLRSDTTLKMMFVTELRKLRGDDTLRLYYDIIRGVSPDQLKSMIVRTCDVYNSPLKRVKRVRFPMRLSEPIQNLLHYLQTEVFACKAARLLRDNDGLVSLLEPNDPVDERTIIRFDVVTPEQRNLLPGEFLVVALVCRYTKNQDKATSLGKSFIFKIIPGEIVEGTKRRIGELRFLDARLVDAITFQAGSRILNGNECIEPFMRPNDLLRIVLPDRARTTNLLKAVKAKGQKKVDPADDMGSISSPKTVSGHSVVSPGRSRFESGNQ
jgi:ubiquitin C-terminal hydrolase